MEKTPKDNQKLGLDFVPDLVSPLFAFDYNKKHEWNI
jgi:hypothetical protein